MLRQLKIRPRLLMGFGVMLLMTAVLVGIGGFGLYVAKEALHGITQQLIPAINITVGARTRLIESQAATATMVASIFNDAGMKQAKADWESGRIALPPDDDEEFIPLPQQSPAPRIEPLS